MANLIRRDPLREMLGWSRAMDRMLNNFYDDGELGFGEPLNLRMPLDVIENDEEFVVKADVAGIDPDNVEITYTDNNLSIKGEMNVDISHPLPYLEGSVIGGCGNPPGVEGDRHSAQGPPGGINHPSGDQSDVR